MAAANEHEKKARVQALEREHQRMRLREATRQKEFLLEKEREMLALRQRVETRAHQAHQVKCFFC